jgi:hypothetical protein
LAPGISAIASRTSPRVTAERRIDLFCGPELSIDLAADPDVGVRLGHAIGAFEVTKQIELTTLDRSLGGRRHGWP